MSHFSKKLEVKELEILRAAVDAAEDKMGRKKTSSAEVKTIIGILEAFLQRKKQVCYGGTAINNILPIEDQFYDKDVEIPDYDFFSPTALDDAVELADIYYKHGYEEVVAQAGTHVGTFKVFVNFIPMADITQVDQPLFNIIKNDAISAGGILYSPPNYLRMLMYLELSRPDGDVGRWEKVLKRLTLLNKHYPLHGQACKHMNFMRDFEENKQLKDELYHIVKQSFIDQGVIFFGGYAASLYGSYMPKKLRKQIQSIPDFDVLSIDPENTLTVIKETLTNAGFKKISVIEKPGIGDIIAKHYELRVDKETIAFIYEPLACHSYNIIHVGRNKVKIAAIDTMLSFYLAFLYANRPYYDSNRILCMSEYLFRVQAKNRLEQKGLLKRFSINCYGEQHTLEDMRAHKAKKFQELKDKRDSREYKEIFLRYVPGQSKPGKHKIKTKKRKTKKKKKTKTTKSKKKKVIKKKTATNKRRIKRVLNVDF